jgi:hypothetical protein
MYDLIYIVVPKSYFYSMMMQLKKISFVVVFALIAIGSKAQDRDAFINVPDSIQTSIYWYWVSGNVSKAGVVKDLEAMKKVGINRAFIGDIGLDDVPYGKVKFRSEEWWDILHTALKTATRLNIKIGIFNGPGWSQSGGPWVTPERSMRYLTASQVMVHGPLSFNKVLVRPAVDFQDVRVVAYPVPADYDTDISLFKPLLSSVPALDSLDNLMDHNEATGVHLAQGRDVVLSISVGKPFTARSLTISTLHQAVCFEGDVQVKAADGYVTLRHFVVDRRGPALNHGFLPWAQSVVALPATTADSFRIVLTKVSGNSGISELKLSPDALVENYREKTLTKMWQTEDLVWHAYLWEAQPQEHSAYVIDPAKVIDISSSMAADGTLRWKVPAGNWVIGRTGMAPTTVRNGPATPAATGLETDKLSKEHIREHFDDYLGEILRRIPPEDRKTFSVVVADSYETGSQNWTDLLLKEFKNKYNYDALPFIPVLQGKVVGSADLSDRFLWDLRRLIADDVAYNYIGGLREVSHQHGLTTWLENYGYFGFPGEFLQYGGQSDEIAGEFWGEGHLGSVENRAASSAAHIYGKVKVSSESFTSAGNPWGRYPALLKPRADRFFTDGVNNTLLHVYIHQPEDNAMPGLGAWFGTEFNRANTWFADMDVFLKYLKRCNMMLQQGQYAADVAYFIGEDAPKLMGITDPPLPKGYSFDYINGEVIRGSLSVKNGRLVLPGGISYSMLVLPAVMTMRPSLLTKIKQLVKDGAVVLGPKPLRSPSLEGYPQADEQVRSMGEELWGNGSVRVHRYGKGLVMNGLSMQEALETIKVRPDLTAAGEEAVLFIHRRLEASEVYFISNQKNERVRFTGSFRVVGLRPELWDAVTGEVRELPSYVSTDSSVSVPLQLAANGSAFIVFRKAGLPGDSTLSNYPLPERNIDIAGPWMVSFDGRMRGPFNPVRFDSLTDWRVHANDSIRYYSGAAWYRTGFRIGDVVDGKRYVLDVGLVKDIAKVTVNGVEVGGCWTAPYQVDITRSVRRGENKLEVKVVNTWVNRLLGDASLPVGQRKTATWLVPDAGRGLESSGLLGPVRVGVF